MPEIYRLSLKVKTRVHVYSEGLSSRTFAAHCLYDGLFLLAKRGIGQRGIERAGCIKDEAFRNKVTQNLNAKRNSWPSVTQGSGISIHQS